MTFLLARCLFLSKTDAPRQHLAELMCYIAQRNSSRLAHMRRQRRSASLSIWFEPRLDETLRFVPQWCPFPAVFWLRHHCTEEFIILSLTAACTGAGSLVGLLSQGICDLFHHGLPHSGDSWAVKFLQPNETKFWMKGSSQLTFFVLQESPKSFSDPSQQSVD